MFRAAFADGAMTIEQTLAEGDKVVTRWTMSGTFSGPMDYPPLGSLPLTGRSFSTPGITIQRVTGGRISDERFVSGLADTLIQMGVIPPQSQTSQSSS